MTEHLFYSEISHEKETRFGAGRFARDPSYGKEGDGI
jgi:hypothetical protein